VATTNSELSGEAHTSEIARRLFINGGAIIDHETPRERRFVAVKK
jgi:hypothetical protein